MSPNKTEAPVAFVLVAGKVRPGESQRLALGDEEIDIPREQRTNYALGIDPVSGRVWARPFSGDIAEYGEVPVFNLGLSGA